MTPENLRSSSHKPVLEGPEFITWRALSEQVQALRHIGQGSALNEGLLAQTKKEPSWQVAPSFLLWGADSLRLEWRWQDAIDLYDEIGRSHAGRSFFEVGFEGAALEGSALCYERLGKVDQALESFALLAAKAPDRAGWAYYEAGRLAEHAGRKQDAAKAYEAAASAGPPSVDHGFSYKELGTRALKRLDGAGNRFFPNPEELATGLAQALRAKDIGALRSLASPTHFTVGVAGAHRHFYDREQFLTHLAVDLGPSTPRTDHFGLVGHGGKRYLHTDGWSGEWLHGPASFLLTHSEDGWEWSGVILMVVTEAWFRDLRPAVKENNQPLSIEIKAPWPSGETFTAGGLLPYIAEQATIVAAGVALVWIPVVGPALAAVAVAGATFALSIRLCGFGPGGFYYNFGSTHVGTDAFAIDFTRYQRGVPYHNISGSSAVLACYAGVVTLASGGARSGDPDNTNSVEVHHTDVDFTSYLPALIRLPYRSKSLHLQGPGRVPVSRTMFVRQGARLGVMDDTGNSAFDHLHFSIHDMDGMGGMSVRPTPMDGQTLGDRDTGRCVSSTNIPFP